jgi:hypothetical protein
MGGITSKVFVVRMPSGNVEFNIDGTFDAENGRFYMTASDATVLCEQLKEVLTES